MGSTTQGPFDPTSTTPVDTQLGNSTSGCILIHNLSQYELYVTTPDALMNSFVAAWGWRRFDVTDPMPKINWNIAATPAQTNPPLSAVFVESYELRAQAPPQYFGVYQRQTSIGSGSVATNIAQQLAASFSQVLLQNATLGQIIGSDFDATNHRARWWASRGTDTNQMGWAFVYRDSGGTARIGLIVDGDGSFALGPSAGAISTIIGDASSNLSVVGMLKSLGGQAAATGTALGAPVIVAQKIRQHVTVATSTTILAFTPTVTGLYRLSLYAEVGSSGAPAISVSPAWTDPDNNAANTPARVAGVWGSASANAEGLLNATAIGTAPATVVVFPLTFMAAASFVVTINYQNNTTGVSDFVTASLERLA